MPMERRGWVIRVIPTLVNRQREEPTGCDGERQLSMDGTSRVSREAQARICERLGVRFPGATRPRGAIPWAYSAVGGRPPPLCRSMWRALETGFSLKIYAP